MKCVICKQLYRCWDPGADEATWICDSCEKKGAVPIE